MLLSSYYVHWLCACSIYSLLIIDNLSTTTATKYTAQSNREHQLWNGRACCVLSHILLNLFPIKCSISFLISPYTSISISILYLSLFVQKKKNSPQYRKNRINCIPFDVMCVCMEESTLCRMVFHFAHAFGQNMANKTEKNNNGGASESER